MSCLGDLFSKESKVLGGSNLRKLKNKKLTSTEFMQVWFHYDNDGNGYLEYTEFCQFMKDLFLKKDCSKITPKEVEKYTADMINVMDTADVNHDGRFEMSELANYLKLEENFLDKIIRQKIITSKHVKAILSHYDSNESDTIEGPEMHAFVGDIARHLGLTLSLSVIQAGIERVKEKVGTDTVGTTAIKILLSEESVKELQKSFTG